MRVTWHDLEDEGRYLFGSKKKRKKKRRHVRA